MKTAGRRKSTNIHDLRATGWASASPKGDRLKATPKRALPTELKGTSAMNTTLSIEGFKASRKREEQLKKMEKVAKELQKRKRKPKG